jgi:hypothetical protein
VGEIDHEEDPVNKGITKCNQAIYATQDQAIYYLEGPILYWVRSIHSDNINTPQQKDENYDSNDVKKDPASLCTCKIKGSTWFWCRFGYSPHRNPYSLEVSLLELPLRLREWGQAILPPFIIASFLVNS